MPLATLLRHRGLSLRGGALARAAVAATLAAASALPGAEEAALSASGPRAALDTDGMLLAGGRRIFVLGSYWNPGTPEGLGELRDAGFNLVRSDLDRDALDRVARAGLLAWVPLGGGIAPAGEEEALRLEEAVRPLLDHPALAVWEVPDEALWNVWYHRQLRLAAEREKLRRLREEREGRGEEAGEIRELAAEEERCRARADWEAAEAAERRLRELLGAPPPDPEIQVSGAPRAAAALLERLLRGYRTMHRIDTRPVWMNFAPRNTPGDLERFAGAADIVGCDIYPVPVEPPQGHSDLVNRQLSAVGDYTERFRRAGAGRPVWMVLQGFGWRDIHEMSPGPPEGRGRRPTSEESRFMLYDAIVHGARGVLYWGVDYAREPPEFWRELRAVVREVARLGSVWAAPDAAAQPAVTHLPAMDSVDRPPRVLAKEEGGAAWLLVVNEHHGGLGVRLRGLEAREGEPVRFAGEPWGCALGGRRVEQGALLLYMPAFSAAVLRLGEGSEARESTPR